jgi:preprotein translocase subunit SecG|tara:strand:+ start:201 stop:506 length:306 start_codon:yes stop_codon:yes gene_type:complete
MENILLTIDIILAVLLIILILIQKSEGGALGLGISQDSFMFSRTAGDFFSRSTAVVATLFIICSLSLTIISRQDLPSSSSIIDKIEENEDDNTPKIPKNNN